MAVHPLLRAFLRSGYLDVPDTGCPTMMAWIAAGRPLDATKASRKPYHRRPPGSAPAAGTIKAVLLDDIRANPGTTAGESAARTGHRTPQAAGACDALTKEGLVRRVGPGGGNGRGPGFRYFPLTTTETT